MDEHQTKVYERIRRILARMLKLKEEAIRPTSHLQSDLRVDSLDVLEIVNRMEEEFQIQDPTDELPTVNTVQDIVDFVDGMLRLKEK